MTASKLDRAFYHNETPLSEQQPSWAISEGEQATALTPELVNQIVSIPQFMAQILSQLVKVQ